MCVARREDLDNFVGVAPHSSDMPIGPGAVGRYSVCETTAKRVKHHQNAVVHIFDTPKQERIRNLVIELVNLNLLEHITADGRIVRVRHNLAPK